MDVYVRWLDAGNIVDETFPDVSKVEYDTKKGSPRIHIHCALFDLPVSILFYNLLEIRAADGPPLSGTGVQ